MDPGAALPGVTLKDEIKGATFITLQEALVQKKVIVRETREVNELSIENISGEEVYVQSGDIVKGGQQDRMMAVDLILPPRSGKIPISAFCVENGRWSQRGSEAVMHLEKDYNFTETAIFDDPAYPKMHFVESCYAGDPTNWWIPNEACVMAMLRSAGFTIETHPEPEVFICRTRDVTLQGQAAYPARRKYDRD